MTDEEVQTLESTIASGQRVAWVSGGEIKEINGVVPSIKSDDEEVAEPGPCGLLVEGGWIALDNVSPYDLYAIRPLFQEE